MIKHRQVHRRGRRSQMTVRWVSHSHLWTHWMKMKECTCTNVVIDILWNCNTCSSVFSLCSCQQVRSMPTSKWQEMSQALVLLMIKNRLSSCAAFSIIYSNVCLAALLNIGGSVAIICSVLTSLEWCTLQRPFCYTQTLPQASNVKVNKSHNAQEMRVQI